MCIQEGRINSVDNIEGLKIRTQRILLDANIPLFECQGQRSSVTPESGRTQSHRAPQDIQVLSQPMMMLAQVTGKK